MLVCTSSNMISFLSWQQLKRRDATAEDWKPLSVNIAVIYTILFYAIHIQPIASWILARSNRRDMHKTVTCWPINKAAYSSGDQIINYLGTIKHYSQQTRSQISDITNCELRTSLAPEAWLHRRVATVLALEPPLRHLNHAYWCHYWGEKGTPHGNVMAC